MDEGMLDGVDAMGKFVNLISSEPEIAKVFCLLCNWEATIHNASLIDREAVWPCGWGGRLEMWRSGVQVLH